MAASSKPGSSAVDAMKICASALDSSRKRPLVHALSSEAFSCAAHRMCHTSEYEGRQLVPQHPGELCLTPGFSP